MSEEPRFRLTGCGLCLIHPVSISVIMYILLAKIFIESVHEICEIQCYLYGTVAGVVIFVRRGQHTPTPHLLEIHMEV